MSDYIEVKGIKVFGHHGVLPEERENGQFFLVDLRIALDLSLAAQSDDLEDTVDYAQVAEGVAEIVASEKFSLIETLAERIADHVLSFEGVREVQVDVRKPDAPLEIEVEDLGVSIHRTSG